jgi:hypothetical protein
MNLAEYEKKYFAVYAAFAEVVKLILEKAIAGSSLPRPQSIQNRAKSVSMLPDRHEAAVRIYLSNENAKVLSVLRTERASNAVSLDATDSS